jgi:hypothetical protein
MRSPARRTAGSTALPLLLTRYLAGHIAQAQWDALTSVLDAPDATPTERAAFAAFCLDAAAHGEGVHLPAPQEAHDLLAATRC